MMTMDQLSSPASPASPSALQRALGSVLALPVDQIALVRSLLGAEQATSGDASPHHNGLSLSVGANASTVFVNTTPDRHNWLLAAPLGATSTNYSNELTITVAVDDQTNVLLLAYPLVAPIQSVIAQFQVVRRALWLTVVNGTSVPCVVSFDVQYASVLEDVVNKVWIPTLTADYSLLKARAQALLRSGQVAPGGAA